MAKRRLKERRQIIDREAVDQSRVVRPAMRPETKHSIIAIILFAVGSLFFLALIRAAGSFGNAVGSGLAIIFGWGKWMSPFLIIWIGYETLRPDRYTLRLSNFLGLFFFLIAGTGFLHLFVPLPEVTEAILDGRGGGYVGLALSYPLRQLMGTFGAAIILTALFLVGFILFFNTSLERLAVGGSVFRRFLDRLHFGMGRLRDNLDRTPEEDAPEELESSRFLTKAIHSAASTAPPASEPPLPQPAVSPEQQLSMFPSGRRRRQRIEIPLDLLEANGSKPSAGDTRAHQERIAKTLANFGIQVEMGDVRVGPTVTQYTLKPAAGVKLNTITTLANDLALSLAAHPIRIEAPIPGQPLVGIEVPNQTVAVVRLRELLESERFRKRSSNLTLAIGKDVAGMPMVADLDPMPHLLIAGATGSGKSVAIHAIIVSLLYENSPDDLRFILVDPKRVEMTVYNEIPHLLTSVITSVEATINALRWLVAEMDRRFNLLSKSGKRNIQQFNASGGAGSGSAGNTPPEPLPYIVLIVDELADLMAVAAREVEGAIIRLAQMARAVGIHLILATQRPSVDVITGLIKANITSRIAFSVVSVVDSRTILDTAGADRLLGRGDMLYLSAQLSKPKRLQGAFVSETEIERVVAYLKDRAKPEYIEAVTEKSVDLGSFADAGAAIGDFESDELLGPAKDVILRAGKASASLLQRRLRVGYARAARLLDLLEEQGIIGPGEGAKPRDILIARSGYEGEESVFESDIASGDAAEDVAEEEGTEESEETPR